MKRTLTCARRALKEVALQLLRWVCAALIIERLDLSLVSCKDQRVDFLERSLRMNLEVQ